MRSEGSERSELPNAAVYDTHEEQSDELSASTFALEIISTGTSVPKLFPISLDTQF